MSKEIVTHTRDCNDLEIYKSHGPRNLVHFACRPQSDLADLELYWNPDKMGSGSTLKLAIWNKSFLRITLLCKCTMHILEDNGPLSSTT